MTTKDKDDQELKDYLEGKDRISDEYRQSATEQPPGHIDAAILAASRRGVSAGPRPLSTYRSWHVPLSIAAVVVLSVLLVFNIPNDTDRTLFEPARQVTPEAPPDQFGRTADRLEMSQEESQLRELEMMEDAAVSAPAPAAEMKAMPSSQQGLSNFAGGNEVSQDLDANAPADTLGGAFNERDDSAQREQAVTESVSVSAQRREEIPSEAEPESRFRAAGDLAGAEMDSIQQTEITECTLPRPEVCAEIYQPVCAIRDTGIRCVTTPCDSTEQVEYANACSACSDPEVIGYIDGRCE